MMYFYIYFFNSFWMLYKNPLSLISNFSYSENDDIANSNIFVSISGSISSWSKGADYVQAISIS